MFLRNLGAVKHKDQAGDTCSERLSVAGPLWTGALHNQQWVRDMAAVANAQQWTGHSFSSDSVVKTTGHNPPQPLQELLQRLLLESDTRLPPWYVQLRDIAQFCGSSDMPRRDILIEALREKGHAACVTHVEVRSSTVCVP